MSLTYQTSLETVTYDGPDPTQPEISGYGRNIRVVAQIENGTPTVTIDGYTFLLEQLETLVMKAKVFEKAAKVFNEGVENLYL